MRLRIRLLLITLVPTLTGCATLRATIDGWTEGHDGLSRSQRGLREALASGDFPTALAWSEDDALLRDLTAGATAYYAAQFERSAALLDTAALLTDERATASLSKNAVSLVTNDMARPYQPRRTERLFVPYYAMLSYAGLGQWEDAAVEARRMVALLARFDADRADDERPLHAAMHYVAGAVFERAGEREAASVAYRNAHALVAGYPEKGAGADTSTGELVVIVERGFVAHRATETIQLTLGGDDREGRHGAEEARPGVLEQIGRRLVPTSATPASSATAPAVPAAEFRQREVPVAASASVPSAERGHRAHGHDDDDDEDGHYLRLAFPSLRRSPHPWAGVPRLMRDSMADDMAASDLRVVTSVDDASAADERRERAAVVTRELARATAKYAVTKAVRDRQGEVAGKLAELGAAMLERADVRSWHLLPQELVLMRVRLPAGRHLLRVEAGDGANLRQADLGPLNVKGGGLTIVATRLWREPAPERVFHCDRRRVGCER